MHLRVVGEGCRKNARIILNFVAHENSRAHNFSTTVANTDAEYEPPKLAANKFESYSAEGFLSQGQLVDFSTRNILHKSTYSKGNRTFNLYSVLKPFGVPCFGYVRHVKPNRFLRAAEWAPETTEEEELKAQEKLTDPSIVKALPGLAHALGEDQLHIVRAIPRNVSGPVILTNSEGSARWINSLISSARAKCGSSMSAAVLAVGILEEKSGEHSVNASLDRSGSIAHPTLINREISPKERKSFQVSRDVVSHRVLGESSGCSFLELNFSSFARHIPRLTLLHHHMAPILGDQLYQMRTQSVLGEKFIVSPERAAEASQYIPTKLLDTLKISVKEYHSLPLCFHVTALRIPVLGPNRSILEIGAPLPDYFFNILNALDLSDCL